MRMSEYQEKASSTAIYPENGTGSPLALAYAGLGASNEAGEVAGKIKKVIRDGWGERPMEKRLQILDEVGDVLWYLAQVCNELNMDLGQAADRNLAKLASRAERGVIGGSGDNR